MPVMNNDVHFDAHDDEKDYLKRLSYDRNRSQSYICRGRIFKPGWEKEYQELVKKQDAAGVTEKDLNSRQMSYSKRRK